jgi:hypothetical protein
MLQALVVAAIVFVGWIVFARLRRDDRVTMPGAMPGPENADSIEALVAAGRRIEAIKQLREESGMGLREAKEAIEALARRLDPR